MTLTFKREFGEFQQPVKE